MKTIWTQKKKLAQVRKEKSINKVSWKEGKKEQKKSKI